MCLLLLYSRYDQRIIHRHVNVSWKANVYDETIYNTCAWVRFAGCTYLRHIILALDTVWQQAFKQLVALHSAGRYDLQKLHATDG